MPRACTCGSAKTSARSLIGPQGTLAASSAASQSARVRGSHHARPAAAPARRGGARGRRCVRSAGRRRARAGRPPRRSLRELAVVADGQDEVAVGHLEHLVRHDVLVRVAGAPRRHAGDEVVGAQVGQHRDLRVEQRHVDGWPWPVASRWRSAARIATVGVHAGEQVGHGHADLLRAAARAVVALAGHAHQAAHALHGEVVAGALAVGPGLAEAGDRAVDEARVARAAGVGASRP